MKVSVVIPTYNRDKCIIDLLNCLLKQDYPDFEIIVIDQSEILTPENNLIIEANQGILKYFKIKEKGRSLAKNYGILIAGGDIRKAVQPVLFESGANKESVKMHF